MYLIKIIWNHWTWHMSMILWYANRLYTSLAAIKWSNHNNDLWFNIQHSVCGKLSAPSGDHQKQAWTLLAASICIGDYRVVTCSAKLWTDANFFFRNSRSEFKLLASFESSLILLLPRLPISRECKSDTCTGLSWKKMYTKLVIFCYSCVRTLGELLAQRTIFRKLIIK